MNVKILKELLEESINETEVTEKELKRLASAIFLVENHYAGDLNKVSEWLKKANLNLGGATPEQLVLSGKSDKLCLFLESLK